MHASAADPMKLCRDNRFGREKSNRSMFDLFCILFGDEIALRPIA
jgi:hypothetical protein